MALITNQPILIPLLRYPSSQECKPSEDHRRDALDLGGGGEQAIAGVVHHFCLRLSAEPAPMKNPLAKKKKRRISKHVLKAQRDRQEREASSQESPQRDAAPVSILHPLQQTSFTSASEGDELRKRSSLVAKDPSEGLLYLTRWKEWRQQPLQKGTAAQMQPGKTSHCCTESWKFNKNTQSWLIRHMYDPKCVPKRTFELLLEYLRSLQGSSRMRVRADALRRALRYQRHIGSEAKPSDQQGTESPVAKESEDCARQVFDQMHWDQLSDHEKRKEYKRARKVLENLQE